MNMSKKSKKRLAIIVGSVATVGAAATLAGGVTFGLFSASGASGANTFTGGTVTVAAGTPASVTCTITTMVPGDSSAGAPIGNKADTACTYNMKYTGSATAYLAVDVAVANIGTALYDGTNTGLQLYLKDGTSTYLTSTAPTGGTTFTAQGGTATLLPVGTTADLLVSPTPAATNATVSFTLNYAVPIASGNTYQGGSSTVTLTFHAVQAGNNPVTGACLAGQQCLPTSTFLWS
jgi:spore coat-associated protein N